MVHIIADTTSCLDAATASRLHIPVIPQVIHFGEESYFEGLELDSAGFMQRLQTAIELPKTAAPPPELFVEQFTRLVPTGEPILCIHPSADVSGTVRSAQWAAQEFPGADIRVIDTRTVASPLGSLVTLAGEWALSGMDADQIEARIRGMIPRARIYFLVDTLEFLAKGGRIGGAAALLAGLLQIKPILKFQDGKVDQYLRERTHKQALIRLESIVAEQAARRSEKHLSVLHAGVPELARSLANRLAADQGMQNVPIFDMPPAIVTHGGPGVMGVGFFTDEG